MLLPSSSGQSSAGVRFAQRRPTRSPLSRQNATIKLGCLSLVLDAGSGGTLAARGDELAGDVGERRADRRRRIERRRRACVAALSGRLIERDATEEARVHQTGDLVGSASPEDVVAAATVWADVVGHVLDDAEHTLFGHPRHLGGLDRRLGGRLLTVSYTH